MRLIHHININGKRMRFLSCQSQRILKRLVGLTSAIELYVTSLTNLDRDLPIFSSFNHTELPTKVQRKIMQIISKQIFLMEITA